jgi:REP element-mobilizing transposase RayT
MSEFIHKKHNVSVLPYHIVCPAKYRRAVFTPEVDEKLKEICGEMSLRYEIEFLEIGADSDHVHQACKTPSATPTFSGNTSHRLTV